MTTNEEEKVGENKIVQVLLQKNEFLNNHLNELSSEKKRYEEKVDSLRRMISESDNLIKELNERIFEKEEKVQVLTNDIALFQKQHEDQILRLQEQLDAKGSLIIKLNAETEELRKQFREEIVQKKDKKIEELVNRIKRANVHMYESEKKMQTEAALHTEEKEKLRKNADEHEKKVRHTQEDIVAHVQVIQALKEKYSQSQEAHIQKEKEIKRLDSELNVMKAQFRAAEIQNNETKNKQETSLHTTSKESKRKEEEYVGIIKLLRKELQEKEEILIQNKQKDMYTNAMSRPFQGEHTSGEDPELYNEVTAMIKMAIDHGDSPERIKVSLQNAGYKGIVIDECFKKISE